MKKILSLILTGTLLSQSSLAVNSINVQTFNPSVSDHFVMLEDAFRSDWPKDSKAFFGLNYNFASEPWVAIDAAGNRVAALIESIQTFDFMLGFKASQRFGLFFGMPIHFIKYPIGAGLANVSPGSSVTAIGDMKLLGKIRLTGADSSAQFALIPEIHLPTGSTLNFVSDASTYLGIRAVLEREFTNFTLNVNTGFAAASNSYYSDVSTVTPIDYRKRFNFGIGGFMPFTDSWGMNLEFNSWFMLPFDKNNNPNELYAGLRHVLGEHSVLTFGGSMGKLGGPSGLNYRAIAGLRFTMYDNKTQNQNLSFPISNAANPPRAIFKAKQIELTTQVRFEEDSSTLTNDDTGLLDEVVAVIQTNKSSIKKIQIDGHTNDNGKAKHNLWLSLERSRAVKKYLISKGIPSTMLEARGYGQMKPKVPAKDPNSDAINRRVEFNIVQ